MRESSTCGIFYGTHSEAMARPRSKNKKRMTVFRVATRGAFARHLKAQIDSNGDNLNLIKPEGEESSSPPSEQESSQLKFQQKLDEKRGGSNPSAFM